MKGRKKRIEEGEGGGGMEERRHSKRVEEMEREGILWEENISCFMKVS